MEMIKYDEDQELGTCSSDKVVNSLAYIYEVINAWACINANFVVPGII